jgi:MOSC domain-containing protein YiiM
MTGGAAASGGPASALPREGTFRIVSLNVSERTGTRKRPVQAFRLEPGRGVAGDAHAGVIEDRQVSFLAIEEIEAASSALGPGDFAENVTTRGLALHELPVGTRLEIGEAVLEVSKIGKECHAACEIRVLVGDCVMPRRGVFARVLRGGEIKNEDIGHYRIR